MSFVHKNARGEDLGVCMGGGGGKLVMGGREEEVSTGAEEIRCPSYPSGFQPSPSRRLPEEARQLRDMLLSAHRHVTLLTDSGRTRMAARARSRHS